MKIRLNNEKPENTNSEMLIIPLFQEDKPPAYAEKALKGKVSELLKNKKFEPELKQICFLTSLGNLKAENIILLGLGKKKDFDHEKLRRAAGVSAKQCKKLKAETVSVDFFALKTKGFAQAFTEGFILGAYNFLKYKEEERKKDIKVKQLELLSNNRSFLKEIKKGRLLAESECYVRDLVNMPACEVTPSYLASEAKKFAKKEKIKIKIFGKKELEKMKMNAILGVSRGGVQEPKLIMMETNPKAKNKIVLAGKGITFDSGGLDIKPWPHMKDMKLDMAGAATVLGTIIAATKLKLPVNVVGLMAASENMPGPSAQKAGDVVVSYSKKTIEILNTDAEGRLVLADTVAFAEEQKPDAIIDLATLTGSCIYALGYAGAALVSNNDDLKSALKKASENTAERIWELPLWQEFREAVKGTVADVKNIGSETVGAGTITAATFIESFIRKTPWAHLDIAGCAWQVEEQDYLPKAASGFGVRLLIDYLENI